MKTKNSILPLLFLMVSIAISSCSSGMGDKRDRNLEQAMIAHLDSISGVQYVGMSDTRELNGGKFQTVVIYYVVDSVGKRTEYNARVITNDDCTEILSWEDLDSQVLGEVKRKVSDKMKR